MDHLAGRAGDVLLQDGVHADIAESAYEFTMQDIHDRHRPQNALPPTRTSSAMFTATRRRRLRTAGKNSRKLKRGLCRRAVCWRREQESSSAHAGGEGAEESGAGRL